MFLPEDEVFGLLWYRHFWRENERLSPVHHFPVCLLRCLWAERRVTCTWQQDHHKHLAWSGLKLLRMIKVTVSYPTYQHLIHDDTKAPPITELVVSILHEDLWGDVVWGSHRGESLTARRQCREWHEAKIDFCLYMMTIQVILFQQN